MSITVEDVLLLDIIEARNIDKLAGTDFAGVSSDSRKIGEGELFFALRGDAFDGHEFLAQAFAKGARCAVVDRRGLGRIPGGQPLFVVEDTTKALGALGRIHRRKFAIPVIAVAGSNGKTTTKEMMSRVLGTTYEVLCTEGNLNNHIGVPQTLFRLTPKHDIAVVEIGTNHFGELEYLCGILEPTHGIITNIGREHMEFFKTLQGVAKGEGELFAALRSGGFGYVNADDRYVLRQAKKLKKKFSYGVSKKDVDVHGTFLRVNARGCAEFTVRAKGHKAFPVRLAVPGRHAMMNALAASAVGISHGVAPAKIQRALKGFRAVNKRMELLSVAGVRILNDTYNANPDSVLSALETLRSVQARGKKYVVLGDMLELGPGSPKEHKRIGKIIGASGFDELLTFGPMAANITQGAGKMAKRHFADKKALAEYLAGKISAGDVVLVKGSRGMKMEQVVVALQEKGSRS
jgi:UDP-N-acetylmuramoyl-tripeptide--D-alanyl-D-alanine ligase